MNTFTLALPTILVLHVSKHPTSVTNWRPNCIQSICRLPGITNQYGVQTVLSWKVVRPPGGPPGKKGVTDPPQHKTKHNSITYPYQMSSWLIWWLVSALLFFHTHSYTGEIHPIRAPGSCSSL